MLADSPTNRDSQLVEQAKAGSLDAFGELVSQHHMNVRWFLSRYIHDHTAVDDLAQEVFVAAMKSIEQLSDPSSLSSWLTAIARNKAISFLRKQSRVEPQASLDPDQVLTNEQIRRAEQSAAFGTDYRELMSVLQECLQSLSTKNRRLVKAFYFENISAEQLAKEYRLKSSTVRMSLLRVRGALAKCMRSKLGEEFEL